MNGTAAAAADSAKAQATSLRGAALSAVDFAKAKLNAALAWAGAKGTAFWATIKGFFASHATILSGGAAALMSVRTVYNGFIRTVTSTIGWVAKAAVKTAGLASRYVVEPVVGLVAKFVGMFNAGWGEKVRNFRASWAAKRESYTNTAVAYVAGTKHVVDAVATAESTSNIVNTGAAVITAGIAVNYLTSGALAAMAISLPVIGFTVASILTGGLFTIGALGVLIAAGSAWTVSSNKAIDMSIAHAVQAEPLVIQGEALWSDATSEPVVVAAEQVVAEVIEQVTIDPTIDAVGLKAYEAQTEAISESAVAMEDLADEIVKGRRPAGKGKNRR
jgi:hypothetical protein